MKRDYLAEFINEESLSKKSQQLLKRDNDEFYHFLGSGEVLPRIGDRIAYKQWEAVVLYIGEGLAEIAYNGSSETITYKDLKGCYK